MGFLSKYACIYIHILHILHIYIYIYIYIYVYIQYIQNITKLNIILQNI